MSPGAPAGPEPGAATGGEDRREQLGRGLDRLRVRVAAACGAAGRDPAGVRVVVTTKTWPASDVVRLAELGVRDLGEAREQEARSKRADVRAAGWSDAPWSDAPWSDALWSDAPWSDAPWSDEGPPGAEGADEGLRWHFLGRLQRNKAAAVADWAALVHSCDSERLADALGRGAERAGRVLPVLVQADLQDGAEPGRGGAPAAGVPALADLVAEHPALRLDGLMAVAPQGEEPGRSFARLAVLAERVRADHPQAVVLSAGMSGDLEEAVAAGATHLRVGRAVLGERPPLR